ncbi:hypothetical protein CGRA01v4_03814 [Colletotrichum graminicola]|nr:hypothetical protein CGRA01v4_03814 [Colletotrichum graminicola]
MAGTAGVFWVFSLSSPSLSLFLSIRLLASPQNVLQIDALRISFSLYCLLVSVLWCCKAKDHCCRG